MLEYLRGECTWREPETGEFGWTKQTEEERSHQEELTRQKNLEQRKQDRKAKLKAKKVTFEKETNEKKANLEHANLSWVLEYHAFSDAKAAKSLNVSFEAWRDAPEPEISSAQGLPVRFIRAEMFDSENELGGFPRSF